MGWFDFLSSGKQVAQPIEAVGNVLDQLFTSDEEELNLENVKLRLAQRPSMAQIELNKVEAAHRSIFVAGWRPFIGWVGGLGLAVYFIPQYIIASYVWVNLVMETQQLQPYPASSDALMELVIAMLGMGVLRTFEKSKGVSK